METFCGHQVTVDCNFVLLVRSHFLYITQTGCADVYPQAGHDSKMRCLRLF